MKALTRLLTFLLIFSLVFTLVACNEDGQISDQPDHSEGITDTSGDMDDSQSQSPVPSDEPDESETPTPSDDPIQSETPAPSDDPIQSETPAPSDDPSESETPSPDPVVPPSPGVTEVLEDGRPWYLVLTNPTHYLSEDYKFEPKALSNGLSVDIRIYDALMQMLTDCQADGLSPIVCSAYRTIDRQTTLFTNKVNYYLADGLSYDEAYTAAAKVVAVPGTSEHHTGLAVDLVALSYQVLDTAQENTAEQQWLMAHCHEYGFILRYPNGTTDITGIIYEPWHYRYVGVEAATEIMTTGITFEEYLFNHYGIE